MKDRVYNGFLSGLIAGIPTAIFMFSNKFLGLIPITWADFMGQFIIGKKPETIIEMSFFIFTQFAFMGVLGALFAFIIPYISSKHLVFKGITYGAILWFILLSAPYIFQIPELENVSLNFGIVSLIAVSIWGSTMAFVLRKIDNKVKS